MANKIESLEENQELRERFGRNGRTDYEQKYSVQSMIKKYIQLLEDEY